MEERNYFLLLGNMKLATVHSIPCFLHLLGLRRRGRYISFICNLSLEFLDCFHDIRFAPSFMPIFKFEHMHRPSKVVVLSSSSCLFFLSFSFFTSKICVLFFYVKH